MGEGGGQAVVEKKKNRRHVKISRSATPLPRGMALLVCGLIDFASNIYGN